MVGNKKKKKDQTDESPKFHCMCLKALFDFKLTEFAARIRGNFDKIRQIRQNKLSFY